MTIAFTVSVVAASFIANEDLRLQPAADHAVVMRNETALPVTLLVISKEESVVHEIPARSEARLTPPAALGPSGR